MYYHSRDGNFTGLFTILSSTSNKMSTYHSLFFHQLLWTRSATFLNVFMMLLSMTSNTSSITPRSFRRPFRESHNSYCICNATWQQLKLTTNCIRRRLGFLCSPISCSQLKAESWTAGSPEHEFTQSHEQPPWTAKIVMACREFHNFLHGKRSEITCDELPRHCGLRKGEQFGTAKDQSPVCQ